MTMEQEYASTLLENAVNQLSRLPGIGRKTALRLALHILRQEERMGIDLGESIVALRKGIRYCVKCHNTVSYTHLDVYKRQALQGHNHPLWR